MVTIVHNTTGKVLRAQFDSNGLSEDEIAITQLQTENYTECYWSFENESFYEGASEETIELVNKPIVPKEVALWRIRAVLSLLEKEQLIGDAINQLPEPSQTGARYVWNYGITVERDSQTVLFLQTVLEMSVQEVDNIFIQANAIQI